MVTPFSEYIIFPPCLVFHKKSFSDLKSLDIILSNSDDGSLEPKRYNIDFLLH